MTAAGIHLGQTIDDLAAAYGSRYQMAYDERMNAVMVQFAFSDESRLRAGLDDDGKVRLLELRASAE